MRLNRVYFVCRTCRVGTHPWDEQLGIDGYASARARQLLCLAGASWSFDNAAKHLETLCGLNVSDNKIREVCQQEGRQMAQWQRDALEAHQPFRQASGEIEFTTDGTSVNTWEGWREMRLGIFSKRERGEAASVANWDDRQLPKPHVRVAFAAIEKSDRFGSRWGRWTRRLGIADTAQVSVLADGASWIWEEVAMHFPGAAGVLDIYHALEHVAETGKALHGEGTEAANAWKEAAGQALLGGGWNALRNHLTSTRGQLRKKTHKESLQALTNYLSKHQEHLNYPERLAEGRAIGSGQVEGACKNLIGRRLKQTGARWRVRRVNRMAVLCCMLYSNHWDAYWASP